MKLVEALAEIGAVAQEVLDDLLSCDAATALETVRRAACTGAQVVLDDPPPALTHESKLPAASILYASTKPCPVQDGPYLWMRSFCPDADAKCLGAAMMDVCSGMSRPVVMFAREDAEGVYITAFVVDAPLAAMEAELFDGRGIPGAFEAKWLGDQAKAAKELRSEIGAWVRKQGYNSVPRWLTSADELIALERPGVLPLLRVRQTQGAEEEAAVKAALRRFRLPTHAIGQLKGMLSGFKNRKVKVKTTFLQGFLPPELDNNCEAAHNQSIMSSLALVVLKHLSDEDYYGVVKEEEDESEDEDDKGGESEEGEEGEDDDVKTTMETVEELEAREGIAETQKEGRALSYHTDKLLMRLVGPTMRPCDSKTLARVTCELDAAFAIADQAFGDSDACIVKQLMRQRGSLAEMMTCVARSLAVRYAFLVLTKEIDGTISDSRLFSHEGEWPVALESVTRLVMFPWLLPVVLDGTSVTEIKIQGVAREKFRVSEAVRVEAERARQIPDEVMQYIRKAGAGLAAIQALESRVGCMEQKLSGGSVTSVPSTAAAVAPSTRVMSDTQKNFKRMADTVEAYDKALERNTRAR
jgi:hypothetical protein